MECLNNTRCEAIILYRFGFASMETIRWYKYIEIKRPNMDPNRYTWLTQRQMSLLSSRPDALCTLINSDITHCRLFRRENDKQGIAYYRVLPCFFHLDSWLIWVRTHHILILHSNRNWRFSPNSDHGPRQAPLCEPCIINSIQGLDHSVYIGKILWHINYLQMSDSYNVSYQIQVVPWIRQAVNTLPIILKHS